MLEKLSTMTNFTFAPNDDEPGVFMNNFVVVDANGVLKPIEALEKGVPIYLHGRMQSWGQVGGPGPLVGKIGPLDTWCVLRVLDSLKHIYVKGRTSIIILELILVK